jgi:hypothetical protein
VQPPVEALARGPVFVVDAVRGSRDLVCERAGVAACGDDVVLVLYGEQTIDAVVHRRDIAGYAVDDDATTVYAFSGLWD